MFQSVFNTLYSTNGQHHAKRSLKSLVTQMMSSYALPSFFWYSKDSTQDFKDILDIKCNMDFPHNIQMEQHLRISELFLKRLKGSRMEIPWCVTLSGRQSRLLRYSQWWGWRWVLLYFMSRKIRIGGGGNSGTSGKNYGNMWKNHWKLISISIGTYRFQYVVPVPLLTW